MAVMANQQLRVPLSTLQKDLGYGEPGVLMNEWTKEQIMQAALQTYMQVQSAMQLAMLQGQMTGTPPGQPGPVPSPQGVPSPSGQNVEGQGFNQALGGASPLTADRGMTREGMTGMSMTGQEAAGGL